MDGDRFDALTRSVGSTATRRGALGGLTAGSVLAALGIAPRRSAAQDDAQSQTDDQGQNQNQNQAVTCVINFTSMVRQGPSTGMPAGTVTGELTFTVTGKGVLQKGSLKRADGSTLLIVTEYADEEGTGRIVTSLQFLDNQFTVVGYFHKGETAGRSFACDVDLWNMTATEDGKTRVLEPVGFEALNASDWTWDAAYERGFCHRAE